eukprot:8913373-Pyramimonas_sp.AAC.1
MGVPSIIVICGRLTKYAAEDSLTEDCKVNCFQLCARAYRQIIRSSQGSAPLVLRGVLTDLPRGTPSLQHKLKRCHNDVHVHPAAGSSLFTLRATARMEWSPRQSSGKVVLGFHCSQWKATLWRSSDILSGVLARLYCSFIARLHSQE